MGNSCQFMLEHCLEGCTNEGLWDSGVAFLSCLVTFSGLSGYINWAKEDLSHLLEVSSSW